MPKPLHMTLQQLLNIPLPIIQAPMAGVQDHVLAAAVSEAGGLGSLPCATIGPEEMRRQIIALRGKTSGPFNVNFFCHAEPGVDEGRAAAWRKLLAPYFAEFGVDINTVPAGPQRLPFNHDAADVVCALKPAVVSFHFGLPSAELLQRVRGCGAKILSTATNVAEAKWLEARGVDAIIAQGSEAGGHRGIFLSKDLNTQCGTLALVPQVVAAVKVPVIAAGGIADARGVVAAMAMGAAGVQVGTAYLL
ncbi:MAG TPA: nitronate monooxygenase, partial [Gemmatales bacterium]|nr:nitronate monooxygenase [Gemmatales bacterium]